MRRQSNPEKILLLVALICMGCTACSTSAQYGETTESQNLSNDPYTHASNVNYLLDFEPMAGNGDVFAVIEIPTGSTAKWEVTKPDGRLKWEFKNGVPRVVKYLGYPGNYGMIPNTLLPEAAGGDGDPLDVIVLGPAVQRGSVIKAKLIGVLKLRDGGEQDDKLIAVLDDTPLYVVDSIEELIQQFPGVTDIIELWFTNYKGPGEIESGGFGEVNEARAILQTAMTAAKSSAGALGSSLPITHLNNVFSANE